MCILIYVNIPFSVFTATLRTVCCWVPGLLSFKNPIYTIPNSPVHFESIIGNTYIHTVGRLPSPICCVSSILFSGMMNASVSCRTKLALTQDSDETHCMCSYWATCSWLQFPPSWCCRYSFGMIFVEQSASSRLGSCLCIYQQHITMLSLSSYVYRSLNILI